MKNEQDLRKLEDEMKRILQEFANLCNSTNNPLHKLMFLTVMKKAVNMSYDNECEYLKNEFMRPPNNLSELQAIATLSTLIEDAESNSGAVSMIVTEKLSLRRMKDDA